MMWKKLESGSWEEFGAITSSSETMAGRNMGGRGGPGRGEARGLSPSSWEACLAAISVGLDMTAGTLARGEQAIELGARLSWSSGACWAGEKGAVGSDQTPGRGLGARGHLSDGRDPTRRPGGGGLEPLRASKA